MFGCGRPCFRGGRMQRAAVWFGLLNAILMLMVASIKISQQTLALSKPGCGLSKNRWEGMNECIERADAARSKDFSSISEKWKKDEDCKSGYVDAEDKGCVDADFCAHLCEFARKHLACIPPCVCLQAEDRDTESPEKQMENMLKKNSCYCPLTCGRGDWLPNVSAAVLILFSIFNLPFEGAAFLVPAEFLQDLVAANGGKTDRLRTLSCLLSGSPKLVKSCVSLLEVSRKAHGD